MTSEEAIKRKIRKEYKQEGIAHCCPDCGEILDDYDVPDTCPNCGTFIIWEDNVND